MTFWSSLLELFETTISLLVCLSPLLYHTFRSKRISDANQDWINCIIFLFLENIPISNNGLRCIKTGIAENHNIYMYEMLSEKAAMRAACAKIVNHSDYSIEQRKHFYMQYPKNFSEMQKHEIREKKSPLLTQRRTAILETISIWGVLAVIVYYKELLETLNNIKHIPELIIQYGWIFAIILSIAVIYVAIMEKIFPPTVNYHSDYQI